MKNFFLPLLFIATGAVAQNNVNKVDNPEMLRHGERQEIIIPDIMGYRALKCDFHLHTVFSDGQVWPTVRIDEAWQRGLDVIAITDHVEYRPNAKYLQCDHNTSYDIALPAAQKRGIQLIKAAELTHWDKAKGGHINALFLTDANAMQRPESSDDLGPSVDAAVAQGAYLIWNHPGWDVDSCQYYDISAQWVKDGKIKAVELFNEKEYYPRAASWVQQYGLSPVAATDAHRTYRDLYADNVQPPLTVVLAKENSMPAIKQAMFDGRMIAVFQGQAVATKELLTALFEACVTITKLPNGNFKITNISSIPFDIRSKELNGHLLPNNSLQYAAKAPVSATITNLHIDEKNDLQVILK